MTRLLWLTLGAILGYALRDPVCQRVHVELRHLDPAIVRQPPEGDEGIQPPDPRTWPGALAHEGHLDYPGVWLSGCPLCEALRWQRR